VFVDRPFVVVGMVGGDACRWWCPLFIQLAQRGELKPRGTLSTKRKILEPLVLHKMFHLGGTRGGLG
jgi:hypothetical protein